MKRTHPAAIILLALTALLTVVLFAVSLWYRPDLYSAGSVAFVLISGALGPYVCGLFLALTAYFTMRRKMRRGVCAGIAAAVLVLAVLMLPLGYVSPLPQLSGGSPTGDLRLAYAALHDDAAPVSETGFFSMITYRTRVIVDGRSRSSFILKKYALRSAGGDVIASRGEPSGLYTVSWSPVTHLPREITPYAPDCGENVVSWSRFSELYADWDARLPDLCFVRVDRLTHPFPEMRLVIAQNGETAAQKAVSGEDAQGVTLALPDGLSGDFTAQLFAVFRDPAAAGGECLCPISNAAEYSVP